MWWSGGRFIARKIRAGKWRVTDAAMNGEFWLAKEKSSWAMGDVVAGIEGEAFEFTANTATKVMAACVLGFTEESLDRLVQGGRR